MNENKTVVKDSFVGYLVKRGGRIEDHKILVCRHVMDAIERSPVNAFVSNVDCKKGQEGCLIKCDIND